MALLVDLAPETIANIISFLDIYNLLLFEQVCSCHFRSCPRATDGPKTSRYLRSVALSRPVWDIQVANLDHTCSPNLHPSVKLEELSAQQLRRIVIEAVQIRDSWTKGLSPSAHLELKQTIVRNTDEDEQVRLPIRPLFFPGGRFLAISNNHMWIRVIDLHDGGRLVWAYDLASDFRHDHEDEAIKPSSYDVGMLEDGPLVVAYSVSLGENDDRIYE